MRGSPAQGRLPIRPTAALSSRLVAELYGERGEERPTSVYVRQAADLRFADGQSCRVYGLTVPEVPVRPRATRRKARNILEVPGATWSP